MNTITKESLLDCHALIKRHTHKTPVLTSGLLDQYSGAELYFKCENFQRAGSFKMRGALHAIGKLDHAQQQRGVVTHSSGNFAQALSLAARSLGVTAHIVMPENAPHVKVEAVKGYGGKVYICRPTLEARAEKAKELEDRYGATFIHPSNNMDVIMGQGTAAMELLDEFPDLQIVMAPVGGGGLIAGTALAAHFFCKDCRTIGGEPLAMDDAYRSMQEGKIEHNQSGTTIADGLRTELGDINFPIIMSYVDSIVRVEEKEIVAAMKLIWERMKILVEPSSAVPFAAVLREPKTFKGKKIGIILSGGNVDLAKLPF
ncbi:MAG: pyridoxal-phosphate dependent enzyme [Sediminicola sp.]|tara:strand:- start:153024 stop:153968 length:945 start_codon:yes stop_codon:yes gene_type:complete